MLDRKAISQARYGLGNPRETNAFAIENRAEKWSIATVQMGNNFAHTVPGDPAFGMRGFLRVSQPFDHLSPSSVI